VYAGLPGGNQPQSQSGDLFLPPHLTEVDKPETDKIVRDTNMDGIRLPWTRRGPPAKPIAVAAPPETAFGLQTVYEPSNPSLNIIFVHGLGGSTKGTWTDSHSGSFWPLWLSELPDFKDARILTFGYNSAWHKIWKPNSVLDISDFAKQLVHDLWLHYANHGNVHSQFRFAVNLCRVPQSLSSIVWVDLW